MPVEETRAVLNRMQGHHLLMAELLYGAGLRLMECIRLRVNCIDIERGMIYVRLGKGGKDRGVPLPKTLAEKLNTQLETVRRIHTAYLAEGFGEAWLSEGFARRWVPVPAIWVGSTFSRPRSAVSTAQRNGAPPPCPRLRAAKGRARGRAPFRIDQAGQLSCLSPHLSRLLHEIIFVRSCRIASILCFQNPCSIIRLQILQSYFASIYSSDFTRRVKRRGAWPALFDTRGNCAYSFASKYLDHSRFRLMQ